MLVSLERLVSEVEFTQFDYLIIAVNIVTLLLSPWLSAGQRIIGQRKIFAAESMRCAL